MENASKALIMAGSILIAIMVISLLVIAYNNLTETMNAKNDEDAIEQVIEFNKQYDVYYRNNLYGSDILSLANKVADYNERQSKEQGYAILDIEVTFKKTIDAYNSEKISNSENIIERNKKYNSNEMKKIADDLNTKIESYKKEKVAGKTIPSLSGLRSNELEILLKEAGVTSEAEKSKIQNKIYTYLGYNSALTNLKSTTFKAKKFEYDDVTKRITKMIFIEI